MRAGPLWHYEQTVDNSSGAVRRVVEIAASGVDATRNNAPATTKRKGSMFIPPPEETPTYDLDGNQTADARWSYTWDGENRMIAAEEKNISVAVAAGVSTPSVTTRQKLEFTYDSQGRRLTKKVYEQRTENGTPGTFVLKQTLVFLYDGWNMIAELSSSGASVPLALLRSYEWGLDLSGTLDGAGGVGGLLIERFHSVTTSTTVNNNQPPPTGAHAPCFDGNGNITELINLATGSVSARYEHGAFGETISVDGGAVAEANPIRFSTKYLDAETGFYDYLNRIYRPSDGRWLNRDPISERGGINLYGMCYNDTINQLDVLGQKVQLCGDRNDIEAWFRELFGVSGIDFSHGNGQGVYTLQGNSAHNQLLISEIAGMLINSGRLFKFESKQELYQHMLARMRVIQFLKNYQPSFGGGKGSRKTPGLKPDGSPETPNGSPSNEDWASSLKSLGSNPSAVTDCSTPPLAAMTLTAAMAGYEITSIFGNYYETTTQNENDWVPGDWGRLANGNLGPYATSYTGGENIVYLGGGLYFAHGLGNLPLKGTSG